MTTERRERGTLSPEEYKKFQEWYGYRGPGKWRFGIGMPQNTPDIRYNKYYRQWLQEEPQAVPVTETTKRVWEEKIGEPLPKGVTVAPESPAETAARVKRQQEEAAGVYGDAGFGAVGKVDSVKIIQEGGYDYEVGFDAEGKSLYMTRIGPSKDIEEEKGMTEAQRAQLEWEKEKYGAPSEQDVWEREWLQEQATSEREWAEQEAAREEEQFNRQMQWYQQQAQMEQQEQERQYMSQLAAQPISWLQYAAYTGEQPVVQEWMKPLMPQQYESQVGQPISGWSKESATGMPELTRPSAQLWSRMAPTAQEQYRGYGQARTGATPADIDWRRRASAPPGGGNRSLSWMR